MKPQTKSGWKQVLAKYGRFVESAQFFYHHRLHERLTALGFRVISIERLAEHPVWHVRVKGSLDAQAKLLLGKSYKGKRPSAWGSGKLLEEQLKAELRLILKQLGQAVKTDEASVIRYGSYFQLVFVWPKGQTGTWYPQPARAHPLQVSGVVRRWIRDQRN